MYARALALADLVRRKSVFLLGPRQTGKSTLLRQQFPKARFVDLLEANTFRELSARPETLRQSLTRADTVVIIDEIQKLPSLLDEVQAMIDRNKALRFVLTGSSARKLKHGRANLLAGRAWFAGLHPLVSAELGPGSLDRRLNVGSLPAVFDSAHPGEDLNAYVGVYLQEEIRAEGLLRSVETFSRLLEVAALLERPDPQLHLGRKRCGHAATHRARALPGARRHAHRGAAASLSQDAKTQAGGHLEVLLLRRRRGQRADETVGDSARLRAVWGALEHLVFLELRAYLDYRRLGHELTFWRTHAGHEVDFLIGDAVAIEVKASSRVSPRDLKGLRALSEDLRLKKRIVVCTEPRTRTLDDGVVVMPVERLLQQLWSDELIAP